MLLEYDLCDLQSDLGYREEITPELVGGATVDVWKLYDYMCTIAYGSQLADGSKTVTTHLVNAT